MTLKNTSGTTLKIASVIHAGDFYQANNCRGKLLPDASRTLSVTFTPTVAGNRPGFLTIQTTLRTALKSCRYRALPAAQAASVNFVPGIAQLRQRPGGHDQQPADGNGNQCRQRGRGFVAQFGFDTAGTDCADFHINSQCGTSLAPNASCVVTVTFKPKADGTRRISRSNKGPAQSLYR